MCAMRERGKDGKTGFGEFSEIEIWSIFSNRYLLMERENLSEYKLFTKQEVLQMISNAWIDGWQQRRYSDTENIDQWEAQKEYMTVQEKI